MKMIIDDGKPIEEKEEPTETKGAEDGAQDDADAKVEDAESQPTDESNPDGGTESTEDGEPGKEDEGQPGEEEATPAIDEISGLKAQLGELTAKLEAALAVKDNKVTPEPQVTELTEEQWAKTEERLGVNREAIKFFTSQTVKAVQQIMGEIERRFGSLDKDKAFQELAKDPQFSDAPTHKKEMDEWLSQFDPSLHSKPELLKSAYWVAKGKNASKVVAKVRKEGERNKQVVGAGRPSAPNTGARTKAPAPLNGYQKHIAELVGGENIYRDLKTKAGKALDA